MEAIFVGQGGCKMCCHRLSSLVALRVIGFQKRHGDMQHILRQGDIITATASKANGPAMDI